MQNEKIRLLFEDDEQQGYDWVVTYHLGYSEFDDDIDGQESEERIVNAPDFDTAVRYAQQYLRKMQTEEETSSTWENAEILSIELH